MIFIHSLLFVLLGLVFGSFSTFLVYRVPAGLPWLPWMVRGNRKRGSHDRDERVCDGRMGEHRDCEHRPSAHRSICLSCGRTLGLCDLVPVLSWLVARGACRHCGAPVSALYPLLEVACALCALLVYVFLGATVKAFALLVMLPFLMALLVIDLRHMILPNGLVAACALVGGGWLALETFYFHSLTLETLFVNHLLGAVVYSGFAFLTGKALTVVLKKEALGFGDVKFFAVAGLWIGLSGFAWFCILSGAFGVGFALLWGKITGRTLFPFGPALIISLFVLLCVDGSLLP